MHEQLEKALEDFRRWFLAIVNDNDAPVADAPPSIDLAGLIANYVGLRQEVNLQTRAVRAQQEQNVDLISKLGQTVDLLLRQSRSESPAEEKQRPLLLTLVELYDALSLANKEIARTRDTILPQLDELADEESADDSAVSPPALTPSRSFWSRWILSPSVDAALRDCQEQAQRAQQALNRLREQYQMRARRMRENAERISASLSALITGYAMGLERIERAFQKHGLTPILTVGQVFDPERMEVLEAVAGTGRPAGEVIDEVRRGYLWNGRVLRFAQVRVARSSEFETRYRE